MLIVVIAVFVTAFHVMLAIFATMNNDINPAFQTNLCNNLDQKLEGCVIPPEMNDPSAAMADPITGGMRLFSEVILNSTIRLPSIIEAFGFHSIIAVAISTLIWIIEVLGVLEVTLRWNII